MCKQVTGKINLGAFPDYKDAGHPIIDRYAIVDYGMFTSDAYEDIANNLQGEYAAEAFREFAESNETGTFQGDGYTITIENMDNKFDDENDINEKESAKVLSIVDIMCNGEQTDCRNLNYAEMARKLLDTRNVPANAVICEIPLNWNRQVVVLFTVPGDTENYYSLFAGIGNDGLFYNQLTITGKYPDSDDFYFVDEDTDSGEIELPDDYFLTTWAPTCDKKPICLPMQFAHLYVCQLPCDTYVMIKHRLQKAIDGLWLSDTEKMQALDDALQSKLCDLTDTIELKFV